METEDDEVVSSTCEKRPGDSQYTAAGFDYKGSASDAKGMGLDQESPIAGLPEPADPATIPIIINYSNPINLEVINKLSIVELTDIDGTVCEDFGNYTITGEIKSGTLNDITGVLILFSYPDSSGLCDIEVNG